MERLGRLVIPPGARRVAPRLVGLALLAGIVAWAARHVDLAEVGRALGAAEPAWLLAAGSCNLLSLVAHAGRWAAIVRPQAAARGRALGVRDTLPPLAAGCAVAIAVPARAGDLLRAHLVARRTGLPTSTVVTSVLLDWLVGVATLIPLLALLALATPVPGWARRALLVLVAVGTAGVLAVRIARPGRGAPHPSGGGGLLSRARAGLAAVHHPGALAAAAAWGLAAWGVELLVALFALSALGLGGGAAAAGLLVVATTAANAVSATPGNAGPFEAAAALVLAGLGVAPAVAVAFALVYHACHLVPTALAGGAVLLRATLRA